MSAAKHTPGPWLIEGRTIYSLMHHGWNRGVEVLKNRFWASCYHDRSVTDEEAEANARLIAAAPELLEALQMFLDDYESSEGDAQSCARVARAAIAKATGEQA